MACNLKKWNIISRFRHFFQSCQISWLILGCSPMNQWRSKGLNVSGEEGRPFLTTLIWWPNSINSNKSAPGLGYRRIATFIFYCQGRIKDLSGCDGCFTPNTCRWLVAAPWGTTPASVSAISGPAGQGTYPIQPPTPTPNPGARLNPWRVFGRQLTL